MLPSSDALCMSPVVPGLLGGRWLEWAHSFAPTIEQLRRCPRKSAFIGGSDVNHHAQRERGRGQVPKVALVNFRDETFGVNPLGACRLERVN